MPESMTHDDIVAAVREALGNHPCRYDVAPKDIDHLIGVVIDVGDGDFRAGVETIRQHHLWLRHRIAKDPQYTENHEAMAEVLDVTKEFKKKVAHGFLLFLLLLFAAALLGYGASKFGIKFGE